MLCICCFYFFQNNVFAAKNVPKTYQTAKLHKIFETQKIKHEILNQTRV